MSAILIGLLGILIWLGLGVLIALSMGEGFGETDDCR